MQTIYLDVCVLCRSFDDQNQLRIRLETDALFLILKRIEMGIYHAIISPVHYKEVNAINEISKQVSLESLLQCLDKSLSYDLIQARQSTERLVNIGLDVADAAHLAFAEQVADFFITCDDKLIKRCNQITLSVTVLNPLTFIALEEQ